jgi:hypothetical protein
MHGSEEYVLIHECERIAKNLIKNCKTAIAAVRLKGAAKLAILVRKRF